ncbi:MAG: Flp1 family type IVb pilin [Fastidiosipilaceae bacterium]
MTRHLSKEQQSQKRSARIREHRQTNHVRKLLADKRGMGTLEVVILIAVLIAIALIFNTAMRKFSNNIFKKVFDDKAVIDQIDPGY